MKVSQFGAGGNRNFARVFSAFTCRLALFAVAGLAIHSSQAFATEREVSSASPAPASPTGGETKEGTSDSSYEPPKTFEAKMYQQHTEPKKLLFSYRHVSTPTAKGYLFTNTYVDTDGNVVAVETTDVIRDGGQLRVHLYKMNQKQTDSEGAVEVTDGVAHFTFTKGGKTKTATEKVGDDFVVGPTLLSYLHHHYDTIRSGGRVKARFVVLDRLETVGFEYYKEKEFDYNGKKAWMIKMKPSSFIISAVVDPLHFTVPLDGSRVWQVDGRTQLKYKDGNKLRDLDADTIYEYPDEH